MHGVAYDLLDGLVRFLLLTPNSFVKNYGTCISKFCNFHATLFANKERSSAYDT